MFTSIWQSFVEIAQRHASLILSCIVLVMAWSGVMAPVNAQPITPSPIVASLFHFSGTRPTNLGTQNHQFAPCPTTPNCVSSQSQDPTHAIPPLSYTGSTSAPLKQLATIIQSFPRTEIIHQTENYLYAEFTSAWMGYVDDVEFYLDEATHTIQVRSASRLGESDLGVNRQRIEAIRAALAATVKPA